MLRKVLRLPRLEYTSIMNQGDFLIEVPSDRTDIPRVSLLAREHFLMQHGSIASMLVRLSIVRLKPVLAASAWRNICAGIMSWSSCCATGCENASQKSCNPVEHL